MFLEIIFDNLLKKIPLNLIEEKRAFIAFIEVIFYSVVVHNFEFCKIFIFKLTNEWKIPILDK